jgi:hypothetical protein
LTVMEALVTDVFYWGTYCQGHNFRSHLIQEVLYLLRVSNTCTIVLHPQSDGMVEHYVKMVEEHLRKIIASHQRDWDARLPIYFIAYRVSTYDTMGLTPASLVFGKELLLPCNPQQRMTHNRSRDKFSGPPTWHPQLCPHTPETGQWPDENSLWQTGQLWWLPWGLFHPSHMKGKLPKL